MKSTTEPVMALAQRQYGWVTSQQLAGAGWSFSRVRAEVERGTLARVERGIFSLPGMPDSFERGVMFACLANGPEAVASHSTAAALLGLDGVSGRGPVHVSVPGRSGRRLQRDGVVLHRTASLDRPNIRRVHGTIPCTSVTRTLIDLGAVADEHVLERAVESAIRHGYVNLDYLSRQLDRVSRPGRRGVGLLRALIVDRGDVPPTDSDLETIAIQLFREELGIEFERQVEFVPGIRVDLGERQLRIACEVDGYAFHSDRKQLLRDNTRQNELVLAGVALVRFGFEHVIFRQHRADVVWTVQRLVELRRKMAADGSLG